MVAIVNVFGGQPGSGDIFISDPLNMHFAKLLFWLDSFGHVFIYWRPSSFSGNSDLFEKPEMSPQGIIYHSPGLPRSLELSCVSLIPYLAHDPQMISHIKPTGEEAAAYLLKAWVCQFYLQTNEQSFTYRKYTESSDTLLLRKYGAVLYIWNKQKREKNQTALP